MNIETFKKLTLNIKNEKSLLRFTLAVVTIISIINYTSIQSIKQNERIVIKTLNQSSQFWVSEKDASDNYLVDIGLYIVQLKNNTTAANVDNNFSKILKLVSPKNYNSIREQLKERSATIKRYNRNSYTFAVSEQKINKKTKEIIIIGSSVRWTRSGVKSPEKRMITIGYEINNATFSITKIKEETL